jgi:bifunctional polynucleotide phosphatase/kinase
LAVFKSRASAAFNQLDIPLSIYAATEKDHFRKPRAGMWTEILNDHDLGQGDLDLTNSIFIGDAGGREAIGGKAKDFSCSDRFVTPLWDAHDLRILLGRNFAINVGITYYTPEEYFLKEPARAFVQSFDPAQYISAAFEGWSSTLHVVSSMVDNGQSVSNGSTKAVYEKLDSLDLVLLCGSPGAGKSTFYKRNLEPLGYFRVNQDTLKTVCRR